MSLTLSPDLPCSAAPWTCTITRSTGARCRFRASDPQLTGKRMAFHRVVGPPPSGRHCSVNTTRATPVFRYNPAKGPDCFATPNACQMLYGATSLPVDQGDGLTFVTKCPTPGCQTAVYGPDGFGQPLATYMWSSSVYQNRLFFGVLDNSYSRCRGRIRVGQPERDPCSNLPSRGPTGAISGLRRRLVALRQPERAGEGGIVDRGGQLSQLRRSQHDSRCV